MMCASTAGVSRPSTWGATVRGTYRTPEAGTRTQYVQYVAPWGKPPCASGTCTTREAGTRSLYVPNGGPGAYVSAQAVTGRSSSSWPRLATRVPARESTCRLASPSSPEGDSSGFACSHSSRSAVR